jgi:ATP-dependent DNA helicase RecG
MTAKEILKLLNATDELENVEAKRATKMGKSIAETICAFTNTGGLREGYILGGVVREEESLFPSYEVVGVPDPDAFQMDVASQCATYFNRPVHPRVTVEEINGKAVVLIHVLEAEDNRKPLFFRKDGLPGGAWIRVGSTDQRCTEEDLEQFFGKREHYDGTFIDRTGLKDIDPDAMREYRRLRGKVNPDAIELSYDDEELLLALDCLADDDSGRLTVAGLLLFGKSGTLRRKFPMQRVDYIRVSGNRWDPDPYDRFRSVDMRGPLMLIVARAVEAIYNDLPKQFHMPEGAIQAQALTIPALALREAVVNSLMHRNYRISGPIQIVRYDNRVEIVNPGFSLKPEAQLGEKGSRPRNPRIAAVFHETNLAEAKGSGIHVMRKLLRESGFSLPTFSSDRERNEFTARMLLHHFLEKMDLEWLARFAEHELSADQKLALIFLREVGAINNSTYRQLVDGEILLVGQDLREMRQLGLIEKKGKTRGTYYVPTFPSAATDINISLDAFEGDAKPQMLGPDAQMLGPKDDMLGPQGGMLGANAQMLGPQGGMLGPQDKTPTAAVMKGGQKQSVVELPAHIQNRIDELGPKAGRRADLESLVVDICVDQAMTLKQLAAVLRRNDTALQQQYLNPLIKSGRLVYLFPEMKNHPDQAYQAPKP